MRDCRMRIYKREAPRVLTAGERNAGSEADADIAGRGRMTPAVAGNRQETRQHPRKRARAAGNKSIRDNHIRIKPPGC